MSNIPLFPDARCITVKLYGSIQVLCISCCPIVIIKTLQGFLQTFCNHSLGLKDELVINWWWEVSGDCNLLSVPSVRMKYLCNALKSFFKCGINVQWSQREHDYTFFIKRLAQTRLLKAALLILGNFSFGCGTFFHYSFYDLLLFLSLLRN